MSTRCQIGFYEKEPLNCHTDCWLDKYLALIYRHSDGYPEGVLLDLIPFLQWFDLNRGLGDTEYVSARTLQYLCNQYDERSYPYYKSDAGYSNAYTGILGHGICNSFHGDIEYYYAVTPKALYVYSCNMDERPEHWKLLSRIDLSLKHDMDVLLNDVMGLKQDEII